MSVKSNELIQRLLQAEEEAEKIIKSAREIRSQKLKEVKTSAEEELHPFRLKEEQKYNEELRQLQAKGDISANLQQATKNELQLVTQDFEKNKQQAMNLILDSVLQIDLSLSRNVKASLMGA